MPSSASADFCSCIIACGKRSLTVKINGVARFNAAAAKVRAQSFTRTARESSAARRRAAPPRCGAGTPLGRRSALSQKANERSPKLVKELPALKYRVERSDAISYWEKRGRSEAV